MAGSLGGRVRARGPDDRLFEEVSRGAFWHDLRMFPGSCYDVADASPFTAWVQSTTPVAKLAAEVCASDREHAAFAPNCRAEKALIEPSASSQFSDPAVRAAARAHPAPAQAHGTAGCPPQESPVGPRAASLRLRRASRPIY